MADCVRFGRPGCNCGGPNPRRHAGTSTLDDLSAAVRRFGATAGFFFAGAGGTAAADFAAFARDGFVAADFFAAVDFVSGRLPSLSAFKSAFLAIVVSKFSSRSGVKTLPLPGK